MGDALLFSKCGRCLRPFSESAFGLIPTCWPSCSVVFLHVDGEIIPAVVRLVKSSPENFFNFVTPSSISPAASISVGAAALSFNRGANQQQQVSVFGLNIEDGNFRLALTVHPNIEEFPLSVPQHIQPHGAGLPASGAVDFCPGPHLRKLAINDLGHLSTPKVRNF